LVPVWRWKLIDDIDDYRFIHVVHIQINHSTRCSVINSVHVLHNYKNMQRSASVTNTVIELADELVMEADPVAAFELVIDAPEVEGGA